MGHDSRTREAETCGMRDESPSPNLGRVTQEEAIRSDWKCPQVNGRGPWCRMTCRAPIIDVTLSDGR